MFAAFVNLCKWVKICHFFIKVSPKLSPEKTAVQSDNKPQANKKRYPPYGRYLEKFNT